jgi:hypothetical protein
MLAPYSSIRWRNNAPEVLVNGTWFGLMAIDGQPTAQIVEFTQKTYGDIWQKRFDEDLVEVLTKIGRPPAATVSLQLRSLENGRLITMPNVPMTEPNRQKIWMERNGANLLAATQVRSTPVTPAARFPKLSPYSSIRWLGTSPQVQVRETWYDLAAIDDQSTEQILDFVHKTYGDIWQKRFEEDLVEVLTRMGHPPDPTMRLKLRELDTGEVIELRDVPMTKTNRLQIWSERNGQSAPPSTSPAQPK